MSEYLLILFLDSFVGLMIDPDLRIVFMKKKMARENFTFFHTVEITEIFSHTLLEKSR